MCNIVVCQNRKPSLSELEKFAKNDGDGIGFAGFSNGSLIVKKGFSAKKVAEVFKAIERLELPVVIHFRTASIGDSVPLLCHPFGIAPEYHAKKASAWLFHNGTYREYLNLALMLSIAKGLQIPSVLSDTAVIAVATYYAGERLLEHLAENSWMKFAVVDKDGVRTYGRFFEEKGLLVSSLTYSYVGHGYVINGKNNTGGLWYE